MGKVNDFISALKTLGDGRYSYYNSTTGTGIGCSNYLVLALKEAGIMVSGDTEPWAIKGILGCLTDTTRFKKHSASETPEDGWIQWFNLAHVSIYYSENGKYPNGRFEAAPESSHGICDNGKTGVGYWSNHNYNCAGVALTCYYEIIETEEKKDMTISSLATSQYITDKHYDRGGQDIKFIIPHHMAGKATGANCAQYFVNNGLENSANYCIGYDGDISCNVPEDYGAWTSSCGAADKQAITIEVSDTSSSDWTIPSKAQDALVNLCVDFIKRYPSLGGKAVYDESDAARVVAAKKGTGSWSDVKGNIILHQWTSNYGTSCPEWHMKQILPELVEKINKKLAGEEEETVKTVEELAEEVIKGYWGNGNDRINKLKAAGYDPTKVQAQVDLYLAKDTTTTIASVAESFPTIKLNSSGATVKILQKELKRLGYYTGDIDGAAGEMTVTAIKGIQRNWRRVYGTTYKVNGSFGSVCWKRLLTGK